MNQTALLIPSLGAATLDGCLQAVAGLVPAPHRVVVVLSGPNQRILPVAGVEYLRFGDRLGFAAAVNAGLAAVAGSDQVALLNDDAEPRPEWLGVLAGHLDTDDRLGAVQGTLTDASGEVVDGRGIGLDRWGLPVQVDNGSPAAPEPSRPRHLLAVSATAALFRGSALVAARLAGGGVFDPAFGSYHEDCDLGLRLHRLGWTAAWVPGACCRHLGSATGRGLRWRHPWWVLANRWRALAGNLAVATLIASLPRLLRGEIRAVCTLARDNWRALAVAKAVVLMLPILITRAWLRPSPGPRLRTLPGGP